MAGALALAALAMTAALAVFCFVKVAGLVLLGQPRREAVAHAVEAPWPMRGAVVFLAARLRRARRRAGTALRRRSSGWRPGPRPRRPALGLDLPGTGSLPTAWDRRRARSR